MWYLTNAHIPRTRGPEDSGRYGAFGGFTKAQHDRVNWVTIPTQEPKKEPKHWLAALLTAALAWLLISPK